MEGGYWIITLISSVISGLIGIGVSTYFYRRYERRQRKFITLKEFAGNRYHLRSDPFSKALNEIFIVFNDSAKVKAALKRFHENTLSENRSDALADQYLVELFKAMCDDISVDRDDFTDSFFLKPFNAPQE